MNYSAMFCTQMLEFDKAPVRVYEKTIFINTYLIDPVLDDGTYSGNVYYVFRNAISDELMTYLVNHPAFKTMYCPKDGLIVFAFSQGNYVKGVVDKFWLGQYSKVDRVYVELYFPAVTTHSRYGSRCVFDQCAKLREHWEKAIGVSLPPDAEVWSKPRLEHETFDPNQVLPLPRA